MTGHGSTDPWSPTLMLGLLRIVEAFAVALAALAAYAIRHGSIDLPFSYVVVVLIGVVLVANALHAARLYEFDGLFDLPGALHKITIALPAVLLVLMALGFVTKTSEDFSRIWVGLWFGLCFAMLVLLRGLLRLRVFAWQRDGKLSRNIVIIGTGDVGKRLVRHLKNWAGPGIRLLGLFDDRRTRVPAEVLGVKVLGTIDDLAAFSRKNRVDEIIIALPWSNQKRVIECMNKVKTVPVHVQLCPDSMGFHLFNRGVRHLGGVPLLSVSEPPISGWDLLMKGTEDRVLAVLITIVLMPVMLIIAAAVKLDSAGPVIFGQKRYGFNNNEFTVYKFRTMADDPSYSDGARQATRDDPRVTRVGAFLRRNSLDELPQLINVLKGDMSLVGPRPHPVLHNEQYAQLIDGYLGRHKVKPGITGWAQVNGLRGETDTLEKMEARVQHDLFYVDHWSLLFDLRILLLTFVVGFRSQNAY